MQRQVSNHSISIHDACQHAQIHLYLAFYFEHIQRGWRRNDLCKRRVLCRRFLQRSITFTRSTLPFSPCLSLCLFCLVYLARSLPLALALDLAFALALSLAFALALSLALALALSRSLSRARAPSFSLTLSLSTQHTHTHIGAFGKPLA
jgi:hypothetical protein